ncbi:MAG TPA: UvrD-helicase domain-containing protein, partial [Polyangiaceae bacterium]|nr:UvrD-helicase domain-containing protein [Polyangiaceae bacterium]
MAHGEGPLLVFAGAGSGKTRVITYRVAHLIEKMRVPPRRILAVTFTNKAAGEMRERLELLIGPGSAGEAWVGTFHATCARLLRRYHDGAGLPRDFVIYDDGDQRSVVARVLKELGYDDRRYPPRMLLSRIMKEKQEGRGPDELVSESYVDDVARAVFEGYQRHLRASGAVDFEDLIGLTARLAEDRDALPGAEMRELFWHVMVDEFQDTNQMQYRLVRALAARRNLVVVGDDDQSIYRWRGGDVRLIRNFRHDFPDAAVVKLEENYRSSGHIVRSALAVIRPSREREPKELYTNNPAGAPVRVVGLRDEREEALYVVARTKEALAAGVDATRVAVFYRIHAMSRVLEEVFRLEGVPYRVVGGTRFFDRAEVKDLIAYLRLAANP